MKPLAIALCLALWVAVTPFIVIALFILSVFGGLIENDDLND